MEGVKTEENSTLSIGLCIMKLKGQVFDNKIMTKIIKMLAMSHIILLEPEYFY